MSTLTLKSLKEENQRKDAEAEAARNKPEETTEEITEEITEDVIDEPTAEESAPEPDGEDNQDSVDVEASSESETDTEAVSDEEVDLPDWQKGDDAEESNNGTFTNSDMRSLRIKMKGKLNNKNDELEAAKARIKELEQTSQPVQAAQPAQTATSVQTAQTSDYGLPPAPKRDDFYSYDDPDASFQQAQINYGIAVNNAKMNESNQARQQQMQHEESLRSVKEAVNKHYESAVKLADESGISPENYQKADFRVRSAVDNIVSGGGDAIVDQFIANLGAGSERVMFNLGINAARLEEFSSLLRSDNTGLKASMFLGKLNHELSAPRKKRTTAPKPIPETQGDGKTAKATERALHKQYQALEGKTDLTARFAIRAQARKQGLDVSKW